MNHLRALAGLLAGLGLGVLSAALAHWKATCPVSDPPTPRPARRYAPLPADDWCPEHDRWYPPESECPGCLAENEGTWGPGDVVGLGPEPPADGWYLDMVRRAAFPGTAEDPWRD